ncbi:hypothetical protein HMPREF3155_12325 [Corynebacterium sp. HMSC06D04]|uniref:hypothetical protein n=1 Tax=Corynebacterium sp. HMSC06D04 TaxID=1581123 RepID=UPI0008A1619A|nr:hypothetical protein [Corynebacterium sp. HMSC06D04]OFT49189.1 hypothetical protein HMPREF3155_12325 [Corynebacterium sp. HMSC06D04]
MRSRRLVATLATAGLALAALSSCTKFDPSADEKPGLHQAVTISVNPKSKRQLLLAELYKQTLESQGRAANVASNEELEATSANEQNLPLIESGDGATNFYIGCTGELLDAFNPVAAREISKRYEEDQKDPSGEDFLATTHVALMNALPPDLAVVAPSSAQGCKEAEPDLPQNYVVVYYKGLFDREERLAVSSLTKFLTDGEIRELLEKTDESGSLEQTVSDWNSQSNAGTVMDTGGDSNSSGGSDLTSGDEKKDNSSKPKS